jgi:hypothetical protein
VLLLLGVWTGAGEGVRGTALTGQLRGRRRAAPEQGRAARQAKMRIWIQYASKEVWRQPKEAPGWT